MYIIISKKGKDCVFIMKIVTRAGRYGAGFTRL
jgi:hypothetical protein